MIWLCIMLLLMGVCLTVYAGLLKLGVFEKKQNLVTAVNDQKALMITPNEPIQLEWTDEQFESWLDGQLKAMEQPRPKPEPKAPDDFVSVFKNAVDYQEKHRTPLISNHQFSRAIAQYTEPGVPKSMQIFDEMRSLHEDRMKKQAEIKRIFEDALRVVEQLDNDIKEKKDKL
jgi:hypothetical protein